MRSHGLVVAIVLLACMQFSALTAKLYGQSTIPSGTVIPVVLPRTIDSAKAKPGQAIVAKVAQDVPFDTWVLRRNSKVFGKIDRIEHNAGRTTLTLQFDRIQLGQAQVPLKAQLRAVADFLAVGNAEIPVDPLSDWFNSPFSWTTTQVGGDVVYRGGGPVQNAAGEIVGTPTGGCPGCGVLDTVPSDPGPECAGAIADDRRPQAMWVFSADACGVYGLNGRDYFGLKFQNGSTVARDGQILLTARDRVKLPGGSGMLLVVTGTATTASE